MPRSAVPGSSSAASGLGSSAFGSPRGIGSFSKTTLSYIAPPPDLSGIPQDIIVPFKNLQKKDSITKAKALDEIVAYVQTQQDGLAEPVLEVWVSLKAVLASFLSLTGSLGPVVPPDVD